MLEFVNVSKSFWTGTQRKVILDRVSFRVELGHSLGILAPNGTGKTTLINMMAGLEKPDETDVEFNRKAGEILRERLEKTTVIIVSHQAATLERFARSAAVLRDGNLNMFDTLEEAKQLYDYETQG